MVKFKLSPTVPDSPQLSPTVPKAAGDFAQNLSPLLVGEVVQAFEQDYWLRRSRTPKSETTWKEHYWQVLKRLPQTQILTPELLIETAIAIPPDTCQRKRFCHVLGSLANFCGLVVDLKRYAGTYSHLKSAPRDLPSDSLIIETWRSITSDRWQYAFALMATYGLRPHELFLLDSQKLGSGNYALTVLDRAKTGSRLVFPFRPEWFQMFNLTDVILPDCTGKNNKDLGSRVCKAFRRLNIPFKPYDLRHAWAIRSMNFGLDISLAAQQMGHSVIIHHNVYHHWISERIHREAYQKILNRCGLEL